MTVCELSNTDTLLLEMGLSPKLLGYSYISFAMELIYQDPKYLRAITKRLYVDVAQAFGVSTYSVERDIRHAIGNLFTYGDYDCINSLFYNSVNPLKGTPTNGEFLSVLYLHTRPQMAKAAMG